MRIAVLFRGKLRDNERNKETIDKVIKSIYKLFDTKEIDFFMHLWGEDSEKNNYLDYIKEENLIIENNSHYHNEIQKIVDEIITNNYDFPFYDKLTILHNDNQYNHIDIHRSKMFGEVSSSISIKKVCELFIKNSKDKKYDLVFMTRPDLAFTEKIDILNVNDDIIYVNQHGTNIFAGAYCYLLSQKNVELFGNMFDYLKNNPTKISPIYHYWYYYYLNEICGMEFKYLNINACVNCDIFAWLDNYPNIKEKMLNFINS